MNRSVWKLSALIVAVTAFFVVQPVRCQKPLNRYDQVMRMVRSFSGSPNVRLLPFGKAISGLSVPAYVITDFTTDPRSKVRIFVCAGQHGDEFDAVKSVLSFSCKLASGSDRELLSKCVFIVVPMANPSGVAADTRLSAEGIDINRDWISLDSLESRYIDSLIEAWKPNLMVDAHEWTGPTRFNGNQIESPHCLSGERQLKVDTLARLVSSETGVSLVESGTNERLFHRSYTNKGYATFLLETDDDESYASKNQIYLSAIRILAEAVCKDSAGRSELSPSSDKFSLSTVDIYLKPVSSSAPPAANASMFNGGALIVVGYGLCLWMLKPFNSERKSRWCRRYVRCDVAEAVETSPLIMRHTPTSITSRSWVNRRLRARYAVPPPEKIDKQEPEADAGLTFRTPKYNTKRGEASFSHIER